MVQIAVLGLGEAGSVYAAGLAQRGARVVAADPVASDPPAGVRLAPGVAAAVTGAELVLSLVGAGAAATVLESALADLPAGAVYADMNTGGADAKQRFAALAADRGVLFADVAILAPVPRARLQTPLLVSGTGAAALCALLARFDIPVTDLGADAGLAASLKLLRSVFMKGLAGLVFEGLSAADRIGARDWLQSQIAAELGPDGEALVQRLLDGTVLHAGRRETEMRDALGYLQSLGASAWMTEGTVRWLQEIASGPTLSATMHPLQPDPLEVCP